MKTSILRIIKINKENESISQIISNAISQTPDINVRLFFAILRNNENTSIQSIEKWERLISENLLPENTNHISISKELYLNEENHQKIIKSALKSTNSTETTWVNFTDPSYILAADTGTKIKAISATLPEIDWIHHTHTSNHFNPTKYLAASGACNDILWPKINLSQCFIKASILSTIAPDCKSENDIISTLAKTKKIYNIHNLLITQDNTSLNKSELNQRLPTEEEINLLEKIQKNGTESLNIFFNNQSNPKISQKNISNELRNRITELKAKVKENKDEESGYYIYDENWQYPAITEKHAFDKLYESLKLPKGVAYIAFPWATLIDLKKKGEECQGLETELKKIKNRLSANNPSKIITVCQHIFAKKYINIFKDIGITDLFWSHACKEENTISEIQIHPFPLYPVQSKNIDTTDRNVLFSFSGAKSNKWYLTDTRNQIIEFLGTSKSGIVIGKEEWHYQKSVYEDQIKNKKRITNEALASTEDKEFIDLLSKSMFSLCPSGTGPNSIRLWESIEIGAIPVILADTYLPPGPMNLWEKACVFLPENIETIKNIPDTLEKLSKNKQEIIEKLSALAQIKLLYGKECFVYDIKVFVANHQSSINTKRKCNLDKSHTIKDTPKSPTKNLIDKLKDLITSNSNDQLESDLYLYAIAYDAIVTRPAEKYEISESEKIAIKKALQNCNEKAKNNFIKIATRKQLHYLS